MTDLDIERRLLELAAGVRPPEVPVEEDLARGRRRNRQVRSLTIVGSVGAMVAVTAGGYLASVAVDGRSDPSPAGTPTPSSEATVHSPAESGWPPQAEAGDFHRHTRAMQTLLDVVAEHLDPEGDNLTNEVSNVYYGDGLGTKLGWREPGQRGLGMLQIYVGPGWNRFVRTSCHYRDCLQRTVDGIETTVIDYRGLTSYVVRNPRSDVTLGATPELTFDTGPLKSMRLTLDQLVEAAADEQLTRRARHVSSSLGLPHSPATPTR